MAVHKAVEPSLRAGLGSSGLPLALKRVTCYHGPVGPEGVGSQPSPPNHAPGWRLCLRNADGGGGGEREGERGHWVGVWKWGGWGEGEGGRTGASADLLAPKSHGRMNNK